MCNALNDLILLEPTVFHAYSGATEESGFSPLAACRAFGVQRAFSCEVRETMEPAYLSAFSALAGSVIGGLTSLTASLLTHHIQVSAQMRTEKLNRRADLYRHFIEEASKLYADAYVHDKPEVSNLVNLYALVSMMRVLSSPRIVETADSVVRIIIETYLAPNKSFRDVIELLDNDEINPLLAFSNACREELRGLGLT